MVFEARYDSYRYSDYFKVDLPSHWLEKRLGYLAKEERAAFVDGPFGSDLKTSDYKEDGIPLIQLNNIRDSKHHMQNMKFVTEDKKNELIRHLAIPGDVVIAKMAEPVARSAIVSDCYSEYVIVADCVKMTPNLALVDLGYLVWAINCDYVRINAELVSTGTTRIRINLSELKKLKIPYPPKIEQKLISRFLDHETAKIDTLIEKQQRLIQLLKEKRQAVISHAVTKGLNPDVPMRDSGVEWLGKVPEHWEVKAVSKLSNKITNGYVGPTRDILVEEGVPYIQATHIKNGKVNFDGAYYVRRSWSEAHAKSILAKGDVLIVQTGAGTGDIGLVSDEEVGFNCHALIIVQPDSQIIIGDYLSMLLQSQYGYSVLYSVRTGGMHPHLNCSEVQYIKLPVPPLIEQNQIIRYIKKKTSTYDALIEKQTEAILLMQERRTALISAAVTGKIDVRNYQAPGA